jgi:serine/threonine kinase 16
MPLPDISPSLLDRILNFLYIYYIYIYNLFFKTPSKITINNKEYSVVKLLGEGGFSFVYLVKDSHSKYAVKSIKISLPEQEDRLLAEIEAHQITKNSRNIIKLLDYECIKEGRRVTEGRLLLPFYEGGTVQNLIDNTPFGSHIPIRLILNITIDVCKGLVDFQYFLSF